MRVNRPAELAYPHNPKDTFHTPASVRWRAVGQLAAVMVFPLAVLAGLGMPGAGVALLATVAVSTC